MHRESEGALARAVVENSLDGRIGENAAIPVIRIVDPDRREGRRKCARRRDMFHRQGHVAAVEIMHPRGLDIRRADGQAGVPGIEQSIIRQFRQRRFQRLRRIKSRTLGAERGVRAQESPGIGLEKAWDGRPRSSWHSPQTARRRA